MDSPKGNFLVAWVLVAFIVCAGCRERALTEPTVQMDAAEGFWIRVVLFQGRTGCRLGIASPWRVIGGQPREATRSFGGMSEETEVKVSAGRLEIGTEGFAEGELEILPGKPHVFKLDGENYRGILRLAVDPSGRTLTAINVVPLEPYLAGVIAAEMPSYWEPMALRTQAIAARTYCLYIKRNFGVNRRWDVRKTAANQVYVGVRGESAAVWDAVNKTCGEVVVCQDDEGREQIFPAYYSSTCGGHTENSKNVFGDSFVPLQGVACPYCKEVAKPGIFYWPMAEFEKSYVAERLFERYPKLTRLGKIEDIAAAQQSDYEGFSRLTMAKLTGPEGRSEFLRCEDLRLTIDRSGRKLRSTIFRLESSGDKWSFRFGRGYGHGVGMCQCGAQALARRGKSDREILSYYYPGSRIEYVY